ncbi:aminotransferase class IV [Flavobacterium crassostreae]|uniref:branched-chain-amino-acid transaminase n=1 Tax=Flavobacterium crassostreae TaxID=1763534 RepID=A0A1B9E7U8_9FLAO|nr:aminotransferase class IV [Flavobacterium crassostreae]OCB77938.1 aminotransferase class IV [Flavobacterium crassostreae]
MINFNGNIVGNNSNVLTNNRAFLYGDAIFETVKIVNSKILFLEDHYFRLMASMRVVRMEIPMHFTMEFFEEQIISLATANNLGTTSRARITVFRNDGGYYLPETNEVSYLIHATALNEAAYSIAKDVYEADLYKDFYITKQLLSSIKSTNRLLHTTASIYAHENGLDNCLLLNDSKNVVEATQGNIFMVSGNKLITPAISEGCLNGVMRRKILELARKMDNLVVLEETISPFDLQKADELFVTNVIKGVQPITKYRKKIFGTAFSEQILKLLNASIA